MRVNWRANSSGSIMSTFKSNREMSTEDEISIN